MITQVCFGQNIDEMPYQIGMIEKFSGTILFSNASHGQFSILIEQENGEELWLYVQTIGSDEYKVPFDTKIDLDILLSGGGEIKGKKVQGYCLSLYGKFEDYEYGGECRRIIWRPLSMEIVQ